MEKAELNEVFKEMVNAILENKLKLQVEEVDTGIFISSVASVEHMKSPAHKGDIKENTGMLVDMKVRDVVKGLLNRLVIRVYIDERGKVLIKNKGIHEAELLESDLKRIKLKEMEKLLEEKSNKISEAVKAALERIMRQTFF